MDNKTENHRQDNSTDSAAVVDCHPAPELHLSLRKNATGTHGAIEQTAQQCDSKQRRQVCDPIEMGDPGGHGKNNEVRAERPTQPQPPTSVEVRFLRSPRVLDYGLLHSHSSQSPNDC